MTTQTATTTTVKVATSTTMMNFFAVVSVGNGLIDLHRICLDSSLQDEITGLFDQQAAELLPDDAERVEYDPKSTYRIDKDQVHSISNFKMPEDFLNAAKRPHETIEFSMESGLAHRIKAIIGTQFVAASSIPRFIIQQFRPTQMLDRKYSIFSSNKVFNRIQQDGITLGHHAVAVHQNGKLYFDSFAIISRILDLSEYEPEASDEEVSDFVLNSMFAPDSLEEIEGLIKSDSFLRRRVGSIRAANILEKISPRSVNKKAEGFDIAVEVVKVGKDEKIRLPKDKKNLKLVVKFLNEEFFHGELTKARYESNSIRLLKTKKAAVKAAASSEKSKKGTKKVKKGSR